MRSAHPSKQSPDTVDYVTCQLANPAEKLIAAPLLNLTSVRNPNTFQSDGVDVLPSEMGAKFDDKGALHLNAFSYSGLRPGISQRTVNESAATVVYLNKNVLKSC